MRLAMRPHARAPSSWPANRAFFAVSFTGRMRFSTKLLSLSTRPSWRKTSNPSHWLARQASFSPCSPLRPGASSWTTPGGYASDHGRSSRAIVHRQPVLVLPRPGSRTRTGISSRPGLFDVFSAFFRRSYTGPGWNAALPTQPAPPADQGSSGPVPDPSGRRWSPDGTTDNDRHVSKSAQGRWHLRSAARPRSAGPVPAPG